MKKILPPLKWSICLFVFSMLIFASCEESSSNGNTNNTGGQSTQDTTQITDTPQDKPVADNRKTLYLQGVYATSNPQAIDNIFDDNPSTIWKTTQGAGPDEGIMIYFQNGADIEKVELQQATGSEFAEVEQFLFYGNGAPIGEARNGHVFENLNHYEIRSEYTALFIRIGTTNQDTEVEVSESDKEGLVMKFSKNHSVGITTIKIFDHQGNEYKLIPPRKVNAEILASSTLEPALAYGTAKLFDTRKEFAWVEGASGYGEGEKLSFSVGEKINIDKIQIWNGYQRSPSHFKANTRLSKFKLGEKGGKMYEYNLRDDDAPQKIDLKVGIRNQDFELEVATYFKGNSYKDLAISELLFFEGDKPLQLIVADDTAQKAIVQKSKNTILEPLLDHRIANDMEYPVSGFFAERSIILRSDGTFVMYLLESESAEDETGGAAFISIADGNWEIENANSESASIKIFGKLLDATAIEAYYGGLNEQAEFEKIFRDKLTIKNNMITGEKILDEIVIR